MRKIPTLYERDPEDPSRLLEDPVESWILEAVRSDASIATEKKDGEACLVVKKERGEALLFRRRTHNITEGEPPEGFVPAQQARIDGKQPGWVPCDRSDPNDQYHFQAFDPLLENLRAETGTYELVGPKIQSNPHGYEDHILIRHGSSRIPDPLFPSYDHEGLQEVMEAFTSFEGIVWWLGNRPIAKVKRKDFGLDWPPDTD